MEVPDDQIVKCLVEISFIGLTLAISKGSSGIRFKMWFNEWKKWNIDSEINSERQIRIEIAFILIRCHQ